MKENIKDQLMSFFIIVTLVNIAIFVCGMILGPDDKIGYAAFIVPVIDGILGVIPGFIMYSKKELTVKQMIVRNIIQLISIELIMYFFSFGFSLPKTDDMARLFAVLGSVAVVYVGVIIIRYFLDARTARKMNDALKLFQSINGND